MLCVSPRAVDELQDGPAALFMDVYNYYVIIVIHNKHEVWANDDYDPYVLMLCLPPRAVDERQDGPAALFMDVYNDNVINVIHNKHVLWANEYF